MKTLELSPLDLSQANASGKSLFLFKQALRRMFDTYGFLTLTGVGDKLVENTAKMKQLALPYFQDSVWRGQVLNHWELRKNGQLGPTDEGEEKHLDPETGLARTIGEKKRYVSVDANGLGWDVEDEVRALIPTIFADRYSIAMRVLMAYEEAHNKKPGTWSGMLSKDEDSYTTARVQWYPDDGFSIQHTDKCAVTVLDFEPGLQIRYPLDGEEFVQIVGPKPGDLVINIGDTLSRMQHGAKNLSTWHRVIVPDDCPPEGRIVFPVFVHVGPEVSFPCGENVKAWCEEEWSRESHVAERDLS